MGEAFSHRAERHQVTVAKAFSKISRATCERDAPIEAELRVAHRRLHEQQVTELFAVFVSLEELRRALDPGSPCCVRALVGVVLPEPEGNTRGAPRIAGIGEGAVCALARRHRLVGLCHPPGRVGQHFEGVAVEAACGVGLPQ